MAKPIKETPFLCGKDADTFVKENKEVKKVSNEEKEDEAFRESLKPDYRKCNKMGYKVCVFLSGKEDIVKLTKELLIHNKQVLAEKNVKKAKERER